MKRDWKTVATYAAQTVFLGAAWGVAIGLAVKLFIEVQKL